MAKITGLNTSGFHQTAAIQQQGRQQTNQSQLDAFAQAGELAGQASDRRLRAQELQQQMVIENQRLQFNMNQLALELTARKQQADADRELGYAQVESQDKNAAANRSLQAQIAGQDIAVRDREIESRESGFAANRELERDKMNVQVEEAAKDREAQVKSQLTRQDFDLAMATQGNTAAMQRVQAELLGRWAIAAGEQEFRKGEAKLDRKLEEKLHSNSIAAENARLQIIRENTPADPNLIGAIGEGIEKAPSDAAELRAQMGNLETMVARDPAAAELFQREADGLFYKELVKAHKSQPSKAWQTIYGWFAGGYDGVDPILDGKFKGSISSSEQERLNTLFDFVSPGMKELLGDEVEGLSEGTLGDEHNARVARLIGAATQYLGGE